MRHNQPPTLGSLLMSDSNKSKSFQRLLQDYFPRDAVQVMEDVRSAREEPLAIGSAEADRLLASLAAPTPR